jgi:hypothetical protein
LCHGTNNRHEKVEKEKEGMRRRGTMRKYYIKYTEKRDKKIGRESGNDRL